MRARMPDRNFLAFPGLQGSDTDRHGWNHRDVAATGGARVLRDGQRVKLNDARRQLAIFGRGRRLIFVPSFARQRIVESPMFDVPLPPLHHHAAQAGVPAFSVRCCVRFRKVQVGIRHSQLFANAIETKLTVRLFK